MNNNIIYIIKYNSTNVELLHFLILMTFSFYTKQQ